MKFVAIIPTRYESVRFPGKALIDIDGKSMIQRVYENTKKCVFLEEVVIATDSKKIIRHASNFADIVVTSSNHTNGTSRCYEALTILGGYNDEDVVINVQGDQPFITPTQIERIINAFDDPEKKIVTLEKLVDDVEELKSLNVVKVISLNGKALTFLRESGFPFKHIGVYGFKVGTLRELVNLPEVDEEEYFKLEQWRWLASGYTIHTVTTDEDTVSIDVPEDLKKLKL